MGIITKAYVVEKSGNWVTLGASDRCSRTKTEELVNSGEKDVTFLMYMSTNYGILGGKKEFKVPCKIIKWLKEKKKNKKGKEDEKDIVLVEIKLPDGTIIRTDMNFDDIVNKKQKPKQLLKYMEPLIEKIKEQERQAQGEKERQEEQDSIEEKGFERLYKQLLKKFNVKEEEHAQEIRDLNDDMKQVKTEFKGKIDGLKEENTELKEENTELKGQLMVLKEEQSRPKYTAEDISMIRDLGDYMSDEEIAAFMSKRKRK